MRKYFFLLLGCIIGIAADAQFQLINGTVTPDAKKSFLFLPNTQKDSSAIENVNKVYKKHSTQNSKLLQQPYPAIEKINAITTLAVRNTAILTPQHWIDTVQQMVSSNPINNKSDLRAQNITGILSSTKGHATVIEPKPLTEYTLADNSIATNLSMNAAPAVVKPLDFIDTANNSNTNPLFQYTLPYATEAVKSQILKQGIYTATKGTAKTIIPIPTDSIIPVETELKDSINNKDTVVATAQQNENYSGNFKPVFYVSQDGNFSVSFSTNLFYMNIDEMGKINNYYVIAAAKSISDFSKKETQVGNVHLTYNKKGFIDSIGGVALGYTYDGKVNKIGNMQISYNRYDFMEKFDNIDIQYNNNDTVTKIANYRVGYKHRQVIGIDDSDGLIVFKPNPVTE